VPKEEKVIDRVFRDSRRRLIDSANGIFKLQKEMITGPIPDPMESIREESPKLTSRHKKDLESVAKSLMIEDSPTENLYCSRPPPISINNGSPKFSYS
jgi:hypothetical protein